MAYSITKPEVTSIRSATWRAMRGQWLFWVVMALSAAFSGALLSFIIPDFGLIEDAGGGNEVGKIVINIALLPVYAFIAYFASVYAKIRSAFWKDIAALNHWTYRNKVLDIPREGVVFQRGHSKRIEHHLSGVINNDREFELFQYSFVTGSGKEAKTHHLSIVTFTFKGNFPHIYLNSKRDWYDVRDGETLPLPREFEKKFSLHAPRKYEIEALAIFTPDVLVKILESRLVRDIEFVEQKMLFCIEGAIDTVEKLEQELIIALEIEDLFDEKLDKFKFHKIGDMPYHLNQ